MKCSGMVLLNRQLVSFTRLVGYDLTLTPTHARATEHDRPCTPSVHSDINCVFLYTFVFHVQFKCVYSGFTGNPVSQLGLRDVTCHGITQLPATRHRLTGPALPPARQAGTRFTYRGGMEG